MPKPGFLNSASAVRLGLRLGRTLPAGLGYGLADAATWILAQRRSTPMNRAIRSNLRVVLGPDAFEVEAEQMRREVLRHAGRANYDLFHCLAQGQTAIRDAVDFTLRTDRHLQKIADAGKGAVVVSGHLSNFDLAGLAYAARGIPSQLLAYARPTASYEMQNELRRSTGFEVTPISVGALRKSLRHLRSGGLVLTGIDRPDPFGSGDTLLFFGRPAHVPTGHVRLALQAGVPLGVAVCQAHPTQRHRYVVDMPALIPLQSMGDRETTVLHYAQQALSILESYIRQRPQEWLMFHPVWEPPHANV